MTYLNATFLCFKVSGKWYATERGFLSKRVFDKFETRERRQQILDDNCGKYPGLSGTGSDFIWIVVPDEAIDFGWPLMLKPT